ncbi:MAG: hypothetical protein LBK60_05305 [Verrucomicrobiales bacterium]|nr:hypothetical protein [Verrucomicrobiales bacterium]
MVIHCGEQAGKRLGDLQDGTVLKIAQWYVPNDVNNADDMRLNDALHFADMEIRTARREAKFRKNTTRREFDWRNVIMHRGKGVIGRKVGEIPGALLAKYAEQFAQEIGHATVTTADDELLLRALRAGAAEVEGQ